MQFLKKIIVAIITLESKLILAKYKPFIVAVTGSVGKTSTKDAIYCVLKRQNGFTRKSEKSLNSEIGLPLTIIGAPNAWHSLSGWLRNISRGLRLVVGKNDYPNCLVLEVGADHPGDIKKVAKWLKPDIAVITKVSEMPVHVEFFGSPGQVFEEKAALAGAVKADGSLILYGDDPKVAGIGGGSDGDAMCFSRPRKVAIPNCNHICFQGFSKCGQFVHGSHRIAGTGKTHCIPVAAGQRLTFGISDGVTVKGFDYEIDGLNEGFSFKVNFGGGRIETVKIKGVIGRQHMYPLLAAAAVGQARGLSADEIIRGLYDYEPPRGRMNVIQGINGSTIIDDTYNSSPDAVMSALETLKEAKCSGRRIAILGDMMELGKYSADEHRKIGAEAIKFADILIAVGPRARLIAETALSNGMNPESVKSFDDSVSTARQVTGLISAGDVILIKGSQAVRLERVTKALLREPEKADKLLVRQEKEWTALSSSLV